MSLLTEAMEPCIMLDKSTVADGYGGFTFVWSNGVEFQAACSDMSPTEIIAAAQTGTKATYKVTTARNINLQYYDVFKRISDGKIFRVTSDGDDKKTPQSATLDMRQVNAEEWEIPSE